MHIKTKAFVISTLKFSDADVIVKCYTQSQGMLSFLVKGIRKSKRGKLNIAYFQPLSYLEVEYTFRSNKNLQFFKEVSQHQGFNTIQRDVYKSTLSLFLAEILHSCIKEEEANTSLFLFIEKTLNQLESAEKIGHFHLVFLTQLSQYLGFYPNQEQIEFSYFNMIDGVFQNKETNKYCFSGQEIEDLKSLLAIDFSTIHQLKLQKSNRLQLLEVLLLYFEIQIQGFRKPLSYQVLQEVFSY